MNQDFVDLLRIFVEAEVRFLVVGAYALALHAKPRATGDLDLWVEADPQNAKRVLQALRRFGAPLTQINEEDFVRKDTVFQIGVAPRRIDILTDLTGVSFVEAWEDRVAHAIGACNVFFLGRQTLIKNKKALGRHKDLADLEALK